MKRFVSKVKNLSQKAAELKAAVQSLPPKVVEIREAVATTTGQLQQLKTEIHHSVADLKADNETRLSEALQEINSSTDVFAKAGFVLGGVDVELSPVQRLLVHLERFDDVHPSMIRSLADANRNRKTTHAILSSLLQARQMADTVELDGLVYSELIVSVGPIPSVRLCWRAEETAETEVAQPVQATSISATVTPSPAPATPSQPYFGQSSFFERRSPQPPPVPAVATTSSATSSSNVSAVAPSAADEEQPPAAETVSTDAPGVRHDPLARFKKMPDLSR
jgi:hypothetical protein